MKDLAKFLLDSVNSGVYAAPASIAALKQAAVACGLAWFEVDLTGVAGKAAFHSLPDSVRPAAFIWPQLGRAC